MGRNGFGRFVAHTLAALAGLVVLAAPAAAHRHLRHYYYSAPAAAPVNAGFGPTAPGASTIVIDAAGGQVISAQGADIPRYPASLTKLMVLDLAFGALQDGRLTLDTPMPVSYHAASVEPVKLGLQPGDTITVRDAILAMTTMSANDAATVLGEFLGGGSEDRCAQMMTLRAHALGMAQTQFYNASGLPNPNQVTTARDLSILARDIVVAYPADQGFFEVQNFNFRGRVIFSNNQMLRIYPGATGMKTGYTILARHNLITSAVRGGRVLIGVALHEPSWGATYAQMTAMLDDGFNGQLAAARPAAPPAAPVPPPVYYAQATPPVEAFSLIPAARADTLRPAKTSRAWAAELGMYPRKEKARSVAVAARELRGTGIIRVARIDHRGRVLWTAQLAGLTFDAAHETCSVMAAHGHTCLIVGPLADHLAWRDTDFGTL